MSDAWGTVTGVTDGAGRPDTVNVNTGGPDGIDAIWDRPGSLRVGDVVVLEQVGSIWLVKACTSRKVIPPDIGSIIDFATSAPGDGKQLSTPYRRADSSDARPHLTFVYSDGAPPVVPPGGNSVPMVATGAGTWDEVNRWRSGIARQGIYDDPNFLHQAYGLWFFGAPPAQLTGVTVTGCKVSVRRTPGPGKNGPVQLHLYAHGYTGPPDGQPSMVFAGDYPGAPQGATVPFDLDLGLARQIASGAVVGLGITSSSRGEYAGYDPGLTLTFSY